MNRDNPEVAEKKMTEINVAYSVLSNEVSRIDYDKKLDAKTAQSAQRKRQSATGSRPSEKSSGENSAQQSSHVDFDNINIQRKD